MRLERILAQSRLPKMTVLELAKLFMESGYLFLWEPTQNQIHKGGDSHHFHDVKIELLQTDPSVISLTASNR